MVSWSAWRTANKHRKNFHKSQLCNFTIKATNVKLCPPPHTISEVACLAPEPANRHWIWACLIAAWQNHLSSSTVKISTVLMPLFMSHLQWKYVVTASGFTFMMSQNSGKDGRRMSRSCSQSHSPAESLLSPAYPSYPGKRIFLFIGRERNCFIKIFPH